MYIIYHIRVTGSEDGWHKFASKKIFDLRLTKNIKEMTKTYESDITTWTS